MAGALFDAPDFPAGQRLVSVGRLRALTDENGLAIQNCHLRRREGLAQIPLRLRLAARVEVFEINGAFPPPDRFAGLLVQRDHELMVAPVEIDDEQTTVKNRRRTGAAVMVADEVTPFPKDFAGLRLEAGCAWRAEAHVNPPLLDHRRRRG